MCFFHHFCITPLRFLISQVKLGLKVLFLISIYLYFILNLITITFRKIKDSNCSNFFLIVLFIVTAEETSGLLSPWREVGELAIINCSIQAFLTENMMTYQVLITYSLDCIQGPVL